MTKRQAKKLTLEVWRYLAEHGEISLKIKLPPKILNKISGMNAMCPLCEYFFEIERTLCRGGCPLNEKCIGRNGLYQKWVDAVDEKTRAAAALAIVRKVEAWKV